MLWGAGGVRAQSPATLSAEAGELFDQGFFLTLGFSFMVGLALGFALKFAFKVALVVGGLILIALVGLQSIGVVEINWAGLEGHYDTWSAWARAHTQALFDLLAANLSGTAAFLAGLAAGLKL
ncbi:hypothetical protein AY586_11350 [Marichromatium gracile]|uniref:Membrane protein (Fun14 family) n=1 Tax=Marichromatium gracile TaxID=1048 RepID=A0ABR5VI60_MARGR|nr:hypothetical protein AY586_11350 [Marichromatium gracile]